jgi:hypothetical protein
MLGGIYGIKSAAAMARLKITGELVSKPSEALVLSTPL